MTVVRKLSQIAPSGAVPALTDQVVGVGGGASDFLYSFQQIGLAIAPGPPAGGNLDFYVDPTGNNANPGTLASPFRTIQRGATVAAQYNYQGLYFPTIHVADSTPLGAAGYDEDITIPNFINVIATGRVKFVGNATTPGNVVTRSFIQNSSSVLINGFQLNATAGANPPCWIVNGGLAEPGSLNLNPAGDGIGFAVKGGSLQQSFGNTYTIKWLPAAGASLIVGQAGTYTQITGMTLNFPVGGASFFNVIDITSCAFFWDYLTAVTGGAVSGRSLLSNGTTTITTSHGAATDLPGDGTWVLRTGALVIAADFGLRGWGSDDFGGSYPNGEVPKDCWGFFSDTGAGGFQGSPRGFVYDDGVRQYFLPVVDYINTQTANYTVGFADVETRIEMNSAGATTVTVDTDANMNSGSRAVPVGIKFKVTNIGAGVCTIAGAGGVTVHNAGTVAQWATAIVYKRATNEWVQTGA